MRHSCTDCVRKHLAQTLVLVHEVEKGYPEHGWIAVGHLAEAEDESLREYPDLSEEIREHRLKYIDYIKGLRGVYIIPLMELIDKVSQFDDIMNPPELPDPEESEELVHEFFEPTHPELPPPS